MRAAVGGKDLVVEMFDTETETRDTDVFECLKLRLVNRPGLAFESDFFGVGPAHVTIKSIDEIAQLPLADVRRRAAAEVREAQLAALKSGHAAVELVLFDQRIEIDLDLRGVLVGVDFEVTEEAALTAERDVNIET